VARPEGRLNPARLAVVRVLSAADEGEHVEEALVRWAPHRGADRALAWNLAWGVLRHREELDAAIAVLASRPVQSIDPIARAALRMGLFELRFSRVPAHAGVDGAVDACKRAGGGRAAGLVNAVLRRWESAPGPSARQQLNHPEWLLQRWEARWGPEAAEAWARRNNAPAPLAIATLPGAPDLSGAFRERGLVLEEATANGQVVPGAFLVRGEAGLVPRLPGFQDGFWWVQDPAATAVADLVGSKPGLRVLDACASPGGKSFRIASAGAEVLAVDRNAERLRLVDEGAGRLGLRIPTCAHDWEAGSLEDEQIKDGFHAVLVDAPCSGLGTLRRHPDIRWRRQPGDLVRNATRQGAILGAVVPAVLPRGLLVYAVCSAEPEEGDGVVRAFLASHEEFELEGLFVTAPPRADEDGFFAARLRRRQTPENDAEGVFSRSFDPELVPAGPGDPSRR
jgi:16S rRNA (cytosine967-C5)-methyltransferase